MIKITVRIKLLAAFSTILCLLLLISGMALYSLNDTNKQYKFLIDDRLQKINIIKDIVTNQKDESLGVRGFLLYGDSTNLQNFQKDKEKLSLSYRTLERTIKKPEAVALLKKLNEERKNYETIADRVIDAKKNGDQQKAITLAKEASVYVKATGKNAEKLINYQTALMQETRNQLQHNEDKTKSIVTILAILSLLVGIGIAFAISRSIAEPIKTVTSALKRIAEGDLTQKKISIKNRDEVGTMVNALNKMNEDLRVVISQVNDSVLQVASQSQELSASSEESAAASQMMALLSQSNAQGSETQMDVVHTTKNTIDKMVNGFDLIHQNNVEMFTSMKNAVTFVHEGSSSVKAVSKQMEEISTSMGETASIIDALGEQSNEIGKITAMITAIADQTNLLALNAAIEAARAGEQGKGFAVVAEEVRKLAEQSKDSAVQITTMVTSIQSGTSKAVSSINQGNGKITQGISFTTAAQEAFRSIEEAVSDVHQKVENVSSSTQSIQMLGEEMVHSVSQVQEIADTVLRSAQESSAATEEQLATVEQISASAQTLSTLAENVHGAISKFKI